MCSIRTNLLTMIADSSKRDTQTTSCWPALSVRRLASNMILLGNGSAMGMHKPVSDLHALKILLAKACTVPELSQPLYLFHWKFPKLQMVLDLQYLYVFAQAITKQKLFVEVLYNGVKMALPGCQDTESTWTLEAFLVRHPGFPSDCLIMF